VRSEGLDVPLIHFGVGTGEILADMASIGVDALGVDYRVDLDDAVARIGRDVTVQGNLDPALLFAPRTCAAGPRTPPSSPDARRGRTSSTSATACP
jgi:uroporphyrinogen-III decarboxylase